MRWIYIITLFFYLSAHGQTEFNEKKKIPLYEIKPCVIPIIKNIVDNCSSDTLCNKILYGYLFFSKKQGENFSITIKPVGYSFYFNPSPYIYGVFELFGKKFYCNGDVPEFIMSKSVSNFIEIEYKPKHPIQNDTSVVSLTMDEFSDLNTKLYLINIDINGHKFSFYFQPCSNLNKKQFKKIKNKKYCNE